MFDDELIAGLQAVSNFDPIAVSRIADLDFTMKCDAAAGIDDPHAG